ncbi:hypothetical protein KYC_21696 [Achromobacter arsenitoxydans SY8]|uniref:Uncharacterized protein n=2 Tax=Achromobacter TaxID=222 RepID=H0FC30_9BURK|nr:hypothetical protein KYC_21696 [Achromobacter arsenitoxydans SY8]
MSISMKKMIAALVLSCPALAAAGDLPDAPFRNTPDERFTVSASPYYQQPERVIANRLKYLGKDGQTNHFCLVGYRWKAGGSQVWLHWSEEESLVFWRGNLDKEIRESSLMNELDGVKWGRDTYEEGDRAAMFPNTLSTRAWKQLAADCEKYGEKYVFEPFAGKR